MDGYQFINGVYVYFVTFTTVDWLPVFINPEPINILIDSLCFCIQNKSLKVYAFVIMPNHIHMVVFDANFDNVRLQKTLIEFRKFTGHKLANYVDNNLPDSLSSVMRGKALADRSRQIWQRGWHPEGLTSEDFLQQKVNYIHENPVRKKYVRLPEHWVYSSAGVWINGEEGEVPVTMVIEEQG